MGFNLRPTDIQAAIGLNQFKKLNYFIKKRNKNKNLIINTLKKSSNWRNQFRFIEASSNHKPSWFSIPIIINEHLKEKKKRFIKFLDNKKIETRPIISGNFMNQPAAKLFKLNKKKQNFPNADKIGKLGFFIGLKNNNIKKEELNHLCNNLLKIDEI